VKTGVRWAIAGMVFSVVISNYLVEFPINDWLTYGAFSYPLTFFVTEVTNFHYGPKVARRVVYIGFIVAVALCFIFANPLIAFASGFAFLVGQLLDISVFTRLRRRSWWLAPASASIGGSAIDTLIFFSIAFWGQGMLWLTYAAGDFSVKLAMDLVMLMPFRMLLWRSGKLAVSGQVRAALG
jgi:uncharacterized PurR-regulated membrane protein YhhQ (DUF165 family)